MTPEINPDVGDGEKGPFAIPLVSGRCSDRSTGEWQRVKESAAPNHTFLNPE
jgi:hypothetical protein